MWHVTCDMWHMTCLGGWTFSQNLSSLALTVCDLWYYGDLEEKAHWMNELINGEAVYRTAPATPGLLKVIINFFLNFVVLFWYWCYYLHRGRDLMPPVCGIFPHFQLLADMVFQWLSFKQCCNWFSDWVIVSSSYKKIFETTSSPPPPTLHQWFDVQKWHLKVLSKSTVLKCRLNMTWWS